MRESVDIELDVATLEERPKTRGGRPTKAAAVARDERLLAIAADMFMDHGFDGTSMERLAETAMIGKATLYARYADKSALFAAVLRRMIINTYGELETEFAQGLKGKGLEDTLRIVARRFLELSPTSLTLGRILAAEATRFPELAKLAVEEGLGRQIRLVASILAPFAATHAFVVDDLPLLADLFLSIVLGRAKFLAMLGFHTDPEARERRVRVAVAIFLRGLMAPDATARN